MNEEIDKLLSAISVLLVFLIFFLSLIEKEIDEQTSKNKPDKAQASARKSFECHLKWLSVKSIFLNLSFLSAFYLLLPKTLSILCSNKFSIWNFDERNTIFVFIEIGLIILFIFSIFKTLEVHSKINE